MPGRESRPGNYHIKAGFFRPESPSPRGPAVRSSRSAGTAISTAVRRAARPCRCQNAVHLPAGNLLFYLFQKFRINQLFLIHQSQNRIRTRTKMYLLHFQIGGPQTLADECRVGFDRVGKPSLEPRSTFSDSAFALLNWDNPSIRS